MQGGSFGKKSESKQLIPESKLTQIISKDDATDIVNNLNTIKDKTNETYKSFDEYFAILKKEGQQCVVDYVKENQNQVYVTDDVIDASKKARAEQIAYNETIRQSTLAFKAASIAKRIFATIGNMAAMWALSKVISVVTDTIGELIHSEENLRQSASDLGSELSNNSSDIEGYKKKIEELKAVINDSSSSFDEVSQARVDLMAVQDELIEKFGTEKDVIESITSAINDQTDALDELNRRAYFQKKNEFNEKTGGDKFADWLSFGNTDDDRVQSNMDKMVSSMRYSFYELETTGNEVLDNLIAKSYGLNIAEDMYGDGKHFQVYGTLDEIQDKLYGIQELSQDFDLSTGFENSFTTISNDVDDALAKFRNLYDQYVLYEKILTDNPDNQYDEQFDLINKAKEAYNEAVKSGNEENIKISANEYAKTLQSAIDLAMGNYDYDVADYFKAMYPELQLMFGEWQFSLNFEPNTDGLQDKVADVLDSIDGVSDGTTSFSVEDIENFNPNVATQEQIDAYGELTNVAETYGLTVKQLIALLQTMGLIQSESYQQLVDTFGQENVNKLSPEDLEIAYTIKNVGNMTFEQLQAEIQKVKDSANETEIFSSFQNSQIGERLQYITNQFKEGEISCKEYFDALNNEIANVDFSNYTNSLEEANAASAQFFADSTQQAASGLSDLINKFDSGSISVSEYLEGYLSIANTLSTLTDELQENSASWNQNGTAMSEATSGMLDSTQSALDNAISTIQSYQDSIYSLEQLMTGAVEAGTDEFTAHTQVIAEDLANIVATGGQMADEIANTLGTTTSEIASSMSENVSNQSLAAQAITANTNAAIGDMANSVGELFDTLGSAISNFKVDISFQKASGNIIDAILGKEPLNFSLEASGESLSTIGSAISSFGKSIASNMAPQMIELPDFSFTGDNKYMPDAGVLDNYNKKLNDMKNAQKGAGKATKDTNDALKEQKEALEAEKEALQEQKEAAEDALQAQIDGIDDVIKGKEKEIDALDDEIDKIKEASEARKRDIELQKAQYDLARAENQRPKLVNYMPDAIVI